MQMNKKQWQEVDWGKSTGQLAIELNKSTNTVSKNRKKHGYQTKNKFARKDKGSKKTGDYYIPPKSQQEYITKCSQESSNSGKFESNARALEWAIVSPDDKIYRFRNLYEFVRQHPHLFNTKDVAWKRKGGKRGTGGEYCNATAGIIAIKGGIAKQWKGWRLLTCNNK